VVPQIVVSGDIHLAPPENWPIYLAYRVHEIERRGVKRQWGGQKRRFSVLFVAESSETSEIRPTLLYVTLNDLEWPLYVCDDGIFGHGHSRHFCGRVALPFYYVTHLTALYYQVKLSWLTVEYTQSYCLLVPTVKQLNKIGLLTACN